MGRMIARKVQNAEKAKRAWAKAKPRARKSFAGETVVHLGNIGHEGEERARFTISFARRNPRTRVYGIDLKKLRFPKGKKPKNLRQLQADFKAGLEKIRDNSVSLIRSEMAFGMVGHEWLNPDEYAQECLKVAYRKLKKGGVIRFIVGEILPSDAPKMFKGTPFEPEKIKVRRVFQDAVKRSYWTEQYFSHPGIPYEITAEK